MPRDVLTTEIRGELILLGTGTSVGVPSIGCPCEVCRSRDPRDKRTRCAALVGLPQGNLLIDTPPDLRQQLLREQVGIVHAVLFTHEHADHIFGLDDLRLFPFYLGHAVPLFCEALVEERRIELRNFGVFEVKERAARKARNPRTGERVDVPEKMVVTFKPGKEMEEKVRQLEAARKARQAAAEAAAAQPSQQASA